MSKRHPNPRLAKIHRTYTVEEIAGLYGIHRNTVRDWIKRGLPTCDTRRPQLVLGRDLVAFIQARRSSLQRGFRTTILRTYPRDGGMTALKAPTRRAGGRMPSERAWPLAMTARRRSWSDTGPSSRR